MVSSIFGTIGDVITALITNLTSALNGITALFWVEGTGETAGHLTILGTLAVIAVGAGIVWFVFNLIRGLIQNSAAKANG